MSYISDRPKVLDPALPFLIRISHARSCAQIVAQKYGAKRSFVLELVRIMSAVDLTDTQCESDLAHPLDVLDQLRRSRIPPIEEG